MRISDWSSDVCSSDLLERILPSSSSCTALVLWESGQIRCVLIGRRVVRILWETDPDEIEAVRSDVIRHSGWLAFRMHAIRQRWKCSRSEEHTSELQSLMRISYAVFCLKKKTLKT